MTTIARRFTILCLAMSVFAVTLSMVVQGSDRRAPAQALGLGSTCSQPSGPHCRIAL